jgi:hypothetical protein
VRTAPLPAARGDAPARQSLELAARGALADGPSWSGSIDRMVLVLSSELSATLAHPRRSPRRRSAWRSVTRFRADRRWRACCWRTPSGHRTVSMPVVAPVAFRCAWCGATAQPASRCAHR